MARTQTRDFSAGHYEIQLNHVTELDSGGPARSMGTTVDGISVRFSPKKRDILVDDAPDAAADAVITGFECFISFTFAEFELVRAYLLNIVTGANTWDVRALTGRLVSQLGFKITLTRWDAAVPADISTYTFNNCWLESDVDFLLANDLNTGSVEFRVFPDRSDTGWKLVTQA